MSVFTHNELSYLTGAPSDRLAHVATVGRDGTPHVVPTGFSYDAAHDAIELGGIELAKTKKYRDVERSGRAAVVVDDLASTDPWVPRGVEVRGRAEAVDGDEPAIRIYPERIVSWGIESDTIGERYSRGVA
jgi:pyridoxamine 5'-phosphate oxidase family protein